MKFLLQYCVVCLFFFFSCKQATTKAVAIASRTAKSHLGKNADDIIREVKKFKSIPGALPKSGNKITRLRLPESRGRLGLNSWDLPGSLTNIELVKKSWAATVVGRKIKLTYLPAARRLGQNTLSFAEMLADLTVHFDIAFCLKYQEGKGCSINMQLSQSGAYQYELTVDSKEGFDLELSRAANLGSTGTMDLIVVQNDPLSRGRINKGTKVKSELCYPFPESSISVATEKGQMKIKPGTISFGF